MTVTAANRRRYQRVPFFARVVTTPLDGSRPIETQTFDISLGGVGLASPRAIPSGQSVRLAFHLNDRKRGPVVEELVARIAHVRSDEHGCTLGVEFLSPLTEAAAPVLYGRMIDL